MRFITFKLDANRNRGVEEIIINLDHLLKVQTLTDAISIHDSDYQYLIGVKDKNDLEKYFDFLLEKLRVIKLEEKPWQS